VNRAAIVACHGVALQVGRAGRQRVLVRDLQWDVHEGERWVVLGPNGAGKSTLLNALAGLRHIEAGNIVYSGSALSALDVTAQAARRALVTDRWHDPFSASVKQTVLTARFRFGSEDLAAEAVATDALARFDCQHLAGADVRTLSRGERQRVAIATAFAQDTPLMLLDEPIAHQDPRHQALVLDTLRHAQGRTLIASLHDVNAALRFATHALLLTGRGTWSAGAAVDVLTAERMSELFQTRFAAWAGADRDGPARVLVQQVEQTTDVRESPPL